MQQATVNGGPDNGRTSAFEYDETGNTTKRTIGTTTQDLTWDPEGHLSTLTEAGKTSSYLYDADGNRLITKNADGSSTLTLPNGDQLDRAANGAKTATRYYTHNGETVAVRTGSAVSYLISDHQGTAMSAIAVGTLAITRRKQLPFGQLRSPQSATFGNRGFVGGTNDPTGLTHLGAREYDPTLGRFLSVDPIIDTANPAQMNAYSYAHNTPLTLSDPDGLCPADLCGNGYPIGGTGQVKGDKTRYTKNASTGSRWQLGPYISKSGKAVTFPGKKTKQQADAIHRAQNAIAAAKKAADKERRRRDGVLINLLKGSAGTAWENAKSAAQGATEEANKLQTRLVGSAYEALARVSRAKCFVDQGLTVCRTAQPMYGRGGTNGGGTYATGFNKAYIGPKRLEHERVHTKQWEQRGFFYIPLYFAHGLNPCHNAYEIAADLKKGGYKC